MTLYTYTLHSDELAFLKFILDSLIMNYDQLPNRKRRFTTYHYLPFSQKIVRQFVGIPFHRTAAAIIDAAAASASSSSASATVDEAMLR